MSAADRKCPLRWYQFRLRTLLAGMTLIVGLLVVWRAYLEPYRRQRETMALIETLGGTYEAGEATSWQRSSSRDETACACFGSGARA